LPAFPAFWTLEGKRRDRAVWPFERKKRKKKGSLVGFLFFFLGQF
jgi:hypothetical protein